MKNCENCTHYCVCPKERIRAVTSIGAECCYDYILKSNVQEIVHAKWIWFNAWEGDDTFGEWKMLCCSHCLESEGARESARYCPNCGAIMDLEQHIKEKF